MKTYTADTPEIPSRMAFRGIMLRSALRPMRGIVDPAWRPANLHIPAEIDKVMAPFDGLTAAPPDTGHAIPKRIWMLWQQGWDAAPELARVCVDSWRRLNPDWELILLDQESLPRYATGCDEIIPQHLSRQHRADIARTMLIAEHGGVWADATMYCSRPLDDWLPHAARSGFFVFSDPRPYRRLENWFIVGARGNYLVTAALELFLAYVREFRHPHRYFWMIYLIEHLIGNDPEARRIWDDMLKLPALGPLVVSRHAFDPEPDERVVRAIEDKLIPVHKLKHNWTVPDLRGTPLGRLTGLASVTGTQP